MTYSREKEWDDFSVKVKGLNSRTIHPPPKEKKEINHKDLVMPLKGRREEKSGNLVTYIFPSKSYFGM